MRLAPESDGWPSGQRQQTVNLPGLAPYVGSNPTPSTSSLVEGGDGLKLSGALPSRLPCGSNSVVESRPSKPMVAGSNPVSRSMWFVYALRSRKDGWLYIGMTSDLERRLKEHNSGYNRSTRSRSPFDLIYSEPCSSRAEAREREKFLKGGKGREFLRTCGS